jgi:hypothetical protein
MIEVSVTVRCKIFVMSPDYAMPLWSIHAIHTIPSRSWPRLIVPKPRQQTPPETLRALQALAVCRSSPPLFVLFLEPPHPALSRCVFIIHALAPTFHPVAPLMRLSSLPPAPGGLRGYRRLASRAGDSRVSVTSLSCSRHLPGLRKSDSLPRACRWVARACPRRGSAPG